MVRIGHHADSTAGGAPGAVAELEGPAVAPEDDGVLAAAVLHGVSPAIRSANRRSARAWSRQLPLAWTRSASAMAYWMMRSRSAAVAMAVISCAAALAAARANSSSSGHGTFRNSR